MFSVLSVKKFWVSIHCLKSHTYNFRRPPAFVKIIIVNLVNVIAKETAVLENLQSILVT